MIGPTISHYRITGKLGAGGMGEVYRATDSKLDRDVAIKVLPESFAQDKERLARFEREAKVLASLDHPNIGAIHGVEDADGKRCLILQLIEGETLTERLRTGAMPIDEALDVCKQIAEALEAAHEKGVIHRDLKPGNIKITPDGKVKVLDFGLAKAAIADSAVAPSDNSQSPTLTADYTRPGVILGTAAYMSPEQARAKPVDKRSDIWSFGCVLYECLTGKCLFRGEDVTDTLATVIKGEPQWTDLPAETPHIIRVLIRKCLVKDRKGRLRDIGDALVDLEKAIADPNWGVESGQLSSAGSSQGISKGVLAAVFVATALISAFVTWLVNSPKKISPPPSRRAEINLHGTNLLRTTSRSAFALSPTDPILVYVSEDGLRLRHLDKEGDEKVPLTEGGFSPFFSPNGEWIGFLKDRRLLRVNLNKGAPIPISELTVFNLGVSWSESNDIVFSSRSFGLMRVDVDVGDPVPLTTLAEGESAHAHPQCLPGGTHVLFMVETGSTFLTSRGGNIAVCEIKTGRHTLLSAPFNNDCTFARYVRSGHLLYVRGSDLYAVQFNLAKFEAIGKPKVLESNISVTPSGTAQFSVSDDGNLVYLPAAPPQTKALTWIHTDGNSTPTGMSGDWSEVVLAPNDSRIAVVEESGSGYKAGSDIFILDIDQEIPNRFTSDPADDMYPAWSLNGEWIYFTSYRNGQPAIWKKRTDGSAIQPARVLDHDGKPVFAETPDEENMHLPYAVLTQSEDFNLYSYPLQTENAKRVLRKESKANTGWPVISPDGKLLAFCSEESGLGRQELYLKFFEGVGSEVRLTQGGALRPRWSKNGDRLYYRKPGGAIWFVRVHNENGKLAPGANEIVANLPSSVGMRGWDINSDGTRILVLENEMAETNAVHSPASVNIIFNWFTKLNKLVPVGKE